MKVEQIAEWTNDVTAQLLGEEAVTTQDLSNIVDIGRQITSLESWRNKYLEALVNRIGRWHYVNRIYSGNVPSLMMDSWEYGSILAKFWGSLKDVSDNPSWELEDGQEYNMNTYHAETVSARFWNKMTTFELEHSILDHQLNDSFSSGDEHAAFVSMLMTNVTNSLNIRNEALIMATVRNFIGTLLHGGKPLQKVNLLAQYNSGHGTSLTPAQALESSDFIRWAIIQIQLVSRRLSKYTKLYNVGGLDRFTPSDRLRIIYHDNFRTAVGAYLYNAPSQFATDWLGLPTGDSIPYWQSPGTDFAFDSTSRIDVEVATETAGSKATVAQTGVVAVMFDKYAMAVCNERDRVYAHYVKKGEFTNYLHKREARYLNDPNEQGVVFYLGAT